jgi:hypothetical protein
MNLVFGGDGVVQRILLEFDSNSFPEVEAAVLHKFGTPSSTVRGDIQNRLGATFHDVLHTWSAKDGAAVGLHRYAGSVSSSTLYFSIERDRRMLDRSSRPSTDL